MNMKDPTVSALILHVNLKMNKACRKCQLIRDESVSIYSKRTVNNEWTEKRECHEKKNFSIALHRDDSASFIGRSIKSGRT
jgi:hypothetical protein